MGLRLPDEMTPEQAMQLLQHAQEAYGVAEESNFSILPTLMALQAAKDGKSPKKERKRLAELEASGLFAPGHVYKAASKEEHDELLACMQKPARSRMGDIPRKEMPQVQAWQAKDDGVPMGKLEFVDPKKLKYTQEKINETKAQGIANHWDTVGKDPVLISRDNWVLDGHHRVEAARKKNKWVRCYRVDLPGRTALNRLKEVEPQVEDPA